MWIFVEFVGKFGENSLGLPKPNKLRIHYSIYFFNSLLTRTAPQCGACRPGASSGEREVVAKEQAVAKAKADLATLRPLRPASPPISEKQQQ